MHVRQVNDPSLVGAIRAFLGDWLALHAAGAPAEASFAPFLAPLAAARGPDVGGRLAARGGVALVPTAGSAAGRFQSARGEAVRVDLGQVTFVTPVPLAGRYAVDQTSVTLDFDPNAAPYGEVFCFRVPLARIVLAPGRVEFQAPGTGHDTTFELRDA